MLRFRTLAGLFACAIGIVPAAAQTPQPDPSQQGNYPPMSRSPEYAPPSEPAFASPEPNLGSPGQPAAPQQGGGSRVARFLQMFREANTTNDGRLTLQQAQAAGLTPVVRHFAELDPTDKGYVTVQGIRSYVQTRRAMRAQQSSGQ